MGLTLKKVINWVERTLQYKHLVSISTAFALLILGFAVYLILQNASIMHRHVKEDFSKLQLVLARQTASHIEYRFEDILDELKLLSWSLEDDEVSRNTVLRRIIQRTGASGLLQVGIISSGSLVDTIYQSENLDSSILHQLKTGERIDESILPGIGEIAVVKTHNKQTIAAGNIQVPIDNNLSPIKNRYLSATLNLTGVLRDIIEGVEQSKSGTVSIIRKSGEIIYSPIKSEIGKNIFEPIIRHYPRSDEHAQAPEELRAKISTGKEGAGETVVAGESNFEDEENILISYTPIKASVLPADRRWIVVVTATLDEVTGPIKEVYYRQFATEAILIIGMVIIGNLLLAYQRILSKRLKEQVSEKEEYLTSILQNSLDAIVFIDKSNRIKVWNKGAESIFGYTADEMLGHTFHRIVPPELDADEELNSITNTVLEKGYIRSYRAQRLTKDGRRITIDLSRTLIHSPEGEILGSAAIIKNVTDEIEMEQRIYNTEKLASIGTLAAGVAHEINNPLAIILGFTDLLLERFDEDSQEYQDLKMIEENAKNAKKIVENMLGFARISEGYEEIVDVNSSIETVVQIIRTTILTKKMELVLSVDKNLPKVKGDTREFQQVIFNLINNAVAAIKEKGGTLIISATSRDDWVHVSITDTGIGIPKRIQAKIFDPFFTTKKVGEGTGLGLSLCYGIVSKYGGKITFTSISREDKPQGPSGTTFTVSMPAFNEQNNATGEQT